ncbi:hypothetical protein D3C81_587910 [compost metagenome]
MNDSRMSGLGASPSQYFARQRIESLVNVPRLFAAIDADPGIVGAGVVYIDADYNVVTLREFRPICSVLPKRVVLQEVKRYLTPEQYVQELQLSTRLSRFFEEARAATLACGSVVLSVQVIFSGGLIVPFTGGTGLVISAAGLVSTGAGIAQCGIGVIRTTNEVFSPEKNDLMNEAGWYQLLMPLLDALSLLGIAGSALNTWRFLQVRKAATGSSWLDLFNSLTRQQRKNLMTEVLSIKHPSLTAKQIKLRQKLGELPKRYTATEMSRATTALIKDALGATLGLAGNDTVKSLALSLTEETES